MLLSVTLGIQSCKKDIDEDNNNSNAISLNFEKSTYSNFEIAQLILSNISLTQSEYTGTIDNDKTVRLIKVDSFLVTAIPQLNEGNHTLKVIINGQEFNAEFSTITQPVIADASNYINNFITEYNNQKNILLAQADSLPTTEKAQLLNDIQLIQEYINEANQQLANASDAEKQIAAQIIQANKVWMDELRQTIKELATSTSIFRRSGVRNHDDETRAAMEKFVEAKIKVIKHIPKIIACAAIGAGVGSAIPIPLLGTGVGAAIGAGIGLGNLLLDLQVLNIAIEDLLNIAFLPFQNLVGSGKTAIQFNNDEFKDLNIKIDYRTLYSADNTSSLPIVNTIVSGLRSVKRSWDDLMNSLPVGLSYGPKTIDNKTTYKIKPVRIHSDYLSLSNINNSDITYSENKTDGFFNVKFNSNSNTDLYFTFNVNYNNSQLGTFSQTFDGVLLANDPCDNGSMTAPVITGVNLECNTDNEIAFLISFTANGTGALIDGSYYGFCEKDSICYPTRLYFLSDGATEYDLAYNSYYVNLKSGNSNSGVIEVTLSYKGECQNGQSAAQSLQTNHPNAKWKFELMNQCNQRSNQVSF